MCWNHLGRLHCKNKEFIEQEKIQILRSQGRNESGGDLTSRRYEMGMLPDYSKIWPRMDRPSSCINCTFNWPRTECQPM